MPAGHAEIKKSQTENLTISCGPKIEELGKSLLLNHVVTFTIEGSGEEISVIITELSKPKHDITKFKGETRVGNKQILGYYHVTRLYGHFSFH